MKYQSQAELYDALGKENIPKAEWPRKEAAYLKYFNKTAWPTAKTATTAVPDIAAPFSSMLAKAPKTKPSTPEEQNRFMKGLIEEAAPALAGAVADAPWLGWLPRALIPSAVSSGTQLALDALSGHPDVKKAADMAESNILFGAAMGTAAPIVSGLVGAAMPIARKSAAELQRIRQMPRALEPLGEHPPSIPTPAGHISLPGPALSIHDAILGSTEPTHRFDPQANEKIMQAFGARSHAPIVAEKLVNKLFPAHVTPAEREQFMTWLYDMQRAPLLKERADEIAARAAAGLPPPTFKDLTVPALTPDENQAIVKAPWFGSVIKNLPVVQRYMEALRKKGGQKALRDKIPFVYQDPTTGATKQYDIFMPFFHVEEGAAKVGKAMRHNPATGLNEEVPITPTKGAFGLPLGRTPAARERIPEKRTGQRSGTAEHGYEIQPERYFSRFTEPAYPVAAYRTMYQDLEKRGLMQRAKPGQKPPEGWMPMELKSRQNFTVPTHGRPRVMINGQPIMTGVKSFTVSGTYWVPKEIGRTIDMVRQHQSPPEGSFRDFFNKATSHILSGMLNLSTIGIKHGERVRQTAAKTPVTYDWIGHALVATGFGGANIDAMRKIARDVNSPEWKEAFQHGSRLGVLRKGSFEGLDLPEGPKKWWQSLGSAQEHFVFGDPRKPPEKAPEIVKRMWGMDTRVRVAEMLDIRDYLMREYGERPTWEQVARRALSIGNPVPQMQSKVVRVAKEAGVTPFAGFQSRQLPTEAARTIGAHGLPTRGLPLAKRAALVGSTLWRGTASEALARAVVNAAMNPDGDQVGHNPLDYRVPTNQVSDVNIESQDPVTERGLRLIGGNAAYRASQKDEAQAGEFVSHLAQDAGNMAKGTIHPIYRTPLNIAEGAYRRGARGAEAGAVQDLLEAIPISAPLLKAALRRAGALPQSADYGYSGEDDQAELIMRLSGMLGPRMTEIK